MPGIVEQPDIGPGQRAAEILHRLGQLRPVEVKPSAVADDGETEAL